MGQGDSLTGSMGSLPPVPFSLPSSSLIRVVQELLDEADYNAAKRDRAAALETLNSSLKCGTGLKRSSTQMAEVGSAM